MIEQLVDLAKLALAITLGTVIGSYLTEWRIRRIIKKELPKICEALGIEYPLTKPKPSEPSCQETP